MEGLALIPLVLSFPVGAFQLIIMFNVKKKSGIKVPVTAFASSAVVLAGVVLSLTGSSSIQLFALCLTIFLENLLLVSFFKSLMTETVSKKKAEPVQETVEVQPAEPVEIPEVSSLIENTIVSAGKDFVFQAADSFNRNSELNQLIDFINESLIREIKADGGAILLIDDFEDVIAVRSFSGSFPPPYKLPDDVPHKFIRVETHMRFAQFGLDENIFGQIARNGKPELITNPTADERIFQNEDEDFLKCGSYIIIPMVIKGTVIGVAALARSATSTPFSSEEFENAQVLTDFACASIKNVYSFQEYVEHSDLTRESEIAGKIQKTLHPQLLPAIPGLSMGNYYNPIDGVCGDYYDVLPSRNDRISFILGDIAGKGMNSLVIMVMIRAIMRLIVNTTQSASTILSWANRGIAIENNIDHFASLSLINYDSTNHKIQYATAGSNPILYYNAEKAAFEKLITSTEPIGVEKTSVYADKEIQVSSNDILVLYSDGLTEATNAQGKQYTAERLMAVVEQNKALSGKEIAGLVKTDIKNFTGSVHQHDDQTLLVIKIQ